MRNHLLSRSFIPVVGYLSPSIFNSFRISLRPAGLAMLAICLFIDAQAQTIRYVKPDGSGNGSSWEQALGDLQQAINTSNAGDFIFVAGGSYKPNRRADELNTITPNDRDNAFVLKPNVQIYGGFEGWEWSSSQRIPHPSRISYLDGMLDYDNEVRSYHVVISLGNMGSACLDGFTITGGETGMLPGSGSITVNWYSVSRGYGAGIYLQSSSPRIANCTFSFNKSGQNTAIYNQSGSPDIDRCVFQYNSGGGAAVFNTVNAAPSITQCLFENNFGGSISNQNNASGLIKGCTFIANNSGIYNSSSSPYIYDCVFSGNRQFGVSNSSSSPPVVNCLFSGNQSWGMANYSNSSPLVTNATFVNNTAQGLGGAVLNNASSPRFSNSIFFNNSSEIHNVGESRPEFAYSLVSGSGGSTDWDESVGIDEGGNIDGDPLFTNPDSEDYTPRPCSPAINAGSNAMIPSGITTDLRGAPRIQLDTVDMGAYESDQIIHQIVDQPLTGEFQNLLPLDNADGVSIPINFSWSPIPEAIYYDLYIWPENEVRSVTPVAKNLTSINYNVSSSNKIGYGRIYKWQVVARRDCNTLEGPLRTFTTRRLPDLVVESISVPATSISETEITVNWTVRNHGDGTASGSWTDRAYFCDQPDLASSTNTYVMGSISNVSALSSDEAYQSNSVTFQIPQGLQGDYYVVVKCNADNNVRETSTANNSKSSHVVRVSLAPPPDLQVTALSVSPLTAFSEDEITVTYTIGNQGPGPTTATLWSDQVLLGTTETVNLSTDRVLGNFRRSGALAVGSSYEVVQKLRLPRRISGQHYVHVVADRGNHVFEYNREDNNSLNSLPLTIIERPTPNLVVSDVAFSLENVSNGQQLAVSWTTANEGSVTTVPSWHEGVYFSTDEVFNPNQDILVGTLARNDSLFSLSSNRTQLNLQIPRTLREGEYYVFVVTDLYNNVYENLDEGDNVSIAMNKIRVENADLRPVELSAPPLARSEETILVQWKVINESPGSVYNNSWTDRIYLSQNQTFESEDDQLLTSSAFGQLLVANGDYTKSTSLTLPAQISGDYYLILIADAANHVFERSETNNVISIPIRIELSPWSDLEVTSVVAPLSDTLGTVISVQYTVSNTGTASLINRSWSDALYLSPTSTLDESTGVLLGSSPQSRSLLTGESYTQHTAFRVNGNLSPGDYYVIVKADDSQVIFENNSEENNTKASASPTDFMSLPPTDLHVVTGRILSSVVIAGQDINVEWTVKNNSPISTSIPDWSDAIYLSDDPVWDTNDHLLGSTSVLSNLNLGESYTLSLTVTVPQEAGGTLFFVVVSDRSNQLNDPDRTNNYMAMTVDGSGSPEVQVVIPPPTDLVPALVSYPFEGIDAQPVMVTANVKNQGAGPTPSANWTDRLYLSTDYQLGEAKVLASRVRNGILAPEDEYQENFEVQIPPGSSGNYYLLFQTDAQNKVYERYGEDNNLTGASIFISPQQPSDLVVREVLVSDEERYAGENVFIGWTLANIGSNVSQGYLREAVYISADTIWDAADVLLGTIQTYVNLPVGQEMHRSIEAPLLNIPIGNYYAIVRTDILDNIVEHDESNNLQVSTGTFPISVRELPLDVLATASLPSNLPVYYKITIPPSLEGETLSLTIKGDSDNGAINRAFVAHQQVPTPNTNDYAGTTPFQANQEVVIPDLKSGIYYVLLAGGYPASSQQQPVEILARIIPFGIKSVDASQGGNTGLVTVKITGARFQHDTRFSLSRSGTPDIQAYRVQFINQTLVFATFDLTGRTTGRYDVEASQPGGASSTLSQSFTITQGIGNLFASLNTGDPVESGFVCSITNVGFEEQFEAEFLTPANARPLVVTSVTISYQNNGSVDIPVPTKYLLSLNEGVPLSFSVKGLQDNKADLVLECKEEGGPTGILRPGASGFFKVYTVSNNSNVPSIDLVITD